MIKVKKIKRRTKIKNKKNILISAYIILTISTIITFSFCFLATPKIEIEKRNLTFSYDEEVKLPKYRAYSMNKDINNKVKIKTNLKKHKVGKYFVTYQVKGKFFQTKELVLIKIVDKKKPIITLKGEKNITVCPNTKYQEEGFGATDEYDGDLTSKVFVQEKENKILYQVEDSSHNLATAQRNITYEDKEKPVITLKGNAKIYLYKNSTYKEEGYSITDNCDQKVKVDVKGTVNTNKLGTYKITYTATDANQNIASTERIIEVISKNPNGQGIIYLTFDDGPSNSTTPKILDILKRKNIPATFFVINHDDSLNYLIKREANEGHSVALHSYTHSYALIYQSTNNYFDDLYKIRDKVQKITGTYSNIIRFPGGSSNTVSKKFQEGIMSTLTNEVTKLGFHYFDWNIDCGDGAGIRDANKIYENVTSNLSKTKENVILMHDFENNYGTLNALENIIDYGINQGYQFRKITMETNEIHHKPNN